MEKAKVVPLCIDLPPSDLTWPLAAFQGQPLDEEGMRHLVRDVSAASEKPMDKESLHDLFDAMWPKLKTAIDTALDGASLTQEPQRSLEDMAAEVVDAVRRMERTGRWIGRRDSVLLDPNQDLLWHRNGC